MRDQVRALVLEALERILAGERADRVLDRVLRAHRELSSADRAAVARRTLAIACLRGRLAFLLSRASPAPASEAPALLAAYLATEEGLPASDVADESGITDPAFLARLGEAPAWPIDPVERLAAECSLPTWLARLWRDEFGAEADALAAAMNRPGPIAVRANRLRATREELAAALAAEGIESKPTRYAADGLELLGRPNVFGSAAWRAGLFEVQDEGSQLVAQLAAANPEERVVDFCAGAGGKTLALAAAMRDRGHLVALDVDARRLADMRPRLARAGATCVELHRIDAAGPLPTAAREADAVLVDAPCSSLGTLRRGPDARWRVRPEEVAEFPRLQRAILQRAAECVRAGGRLVYATCTLNGRENEEVAEAFEAAHPEFARTAPGGFLGARLAEELGAARELKLLPNRHGCDGFYACAWARRG